MDEDMEIEYIGESAATTGTAQEERELTPQEYYEEAMQDIQLLDVITQTKNVAVMYRKTARKLKKAGDYLDAAQLAAEYRKKARQYRKKAKEEIYEKACAQMENAQTVAEQRLAIDMFQRIPGYRDADELARAFEKQNRKTANRIQLRNTLMAIAVMLGMAALMVLIR